MSYSLIVLLRLLANSHCTSTLLSIIHCNVQEEAIGGP